MLHLVSVRAPCEAPSWADVHRHLSSQSALPARLEQREPDRSSTSEHNKPCTTSHTYAALLTRWLVSASATIITGRSAARRARGAHVTRLAGTGEPAIHDRAG